MPGVVDQRSFRAMASGGLGLLAAAALMALAFGPWATVLNTPADGVDDEFAFVCGAISLAGLLVLTFWRRGTVATFPLAAGLTCFVFVTYTVIDPDNLVSRPEKHVPVDPQWAAWGALIASGGVVVAAVAVLADALVSARANGWAQSTIPLIRPRTHVRFASQGGLGVEGLRRLTVKAERRERAYRRSFADVAGRLMPYLTAERGGLVYLLPARQKFGIGRFANPAWPEHRHLERAVKTLGSLGTKVDGTVFVDVGANVGTTIVAALGQYGFAAGWAIEPERENLRLLRTNLAANGLADRARVVEAAASSEAGLGELVLRPESGGKHHLRSPGKHARSGTESVRVLALDSLVEDGLKLESVGLLWLDIQGHELEALQGAPRLLEQGPPIVMEFDSRELSGSRLAELRSVLSTSYTHAVDLGEPTRRAVFVPLAEVEEIAARHAGTFTDILIVGKR